MFDCHYHLDETTVPLVGLMNSQDAAGVKKTALIAAMCPDVAPNAFTRLAGPILRRAISARGKAIPAAARAIYASLVKKNGMVDIGGSLYSISAQPDNDRVMKAVGRQPERFVGWIFVNPAGPADPEHEIRRCVKRPGMIGVKAHPYWHNYPVARLFKAAGVCRELSLPMLIHLGTEEKGDFTALVDRFPDVTFIFAHAGLPYNRQVCSLANRRENVFVDLSCSAYVDEKIAKIALSLAGPDKCLFGSDGPYFHHEKGKFDYPRFSAFLGSLGLPAQDLEKVAEKNFARIVAKSLVAAEARRAAAKAAPSPEAPKAQEEAAPEEAVKAPEPAPKPATKKAAPKKAAAKKEAKPAKKKAAGKAEAPAKAAAKEEKAAPEKKPESVSAKADAPKARKKPAGKKALTQKSSPAPKAGKAAAKPKAPRKKAKAPAEESGAKKE